MDTSREWKWDPWQKKVLEHRGFVTLRIGRQSGKSTVIAKKAHDFATEHPGTRTLVIAASVEQAGFIFEKIKAHFDEDDDELLEEAVKKWQEKKGRAPTSREIANIRMKVSIYEVPPTQKKITLKNGSTIHKLAVGRTGTFIRGLAIDLLIADEAAYIPEPVWNALLPMVAVSQNTRGLGWIFLLSTPYGKGGYFYESFQDPDFMHVHVSSEQCPRISAKFLMKERQRMSKQEYAQEYLAEFVDEWNQFFPTKLIKNCATLGPFDTRTDIEKGKSYYLGVDVARYGGDETAFVIAELDHRKHVKIIKAIATERTSLTDTAGRIGILDDKFSFKRIFIDDGGLGAGLLDILWEKLGKRRIVGLNNARRSVDKEDRKKAILKEDLYSNALVLMESNKLNMAYDLKLMKSLKSIEFEYTSDKNLRLSGKYSHLAEAFVRACWCVREKGHKLFISSF